MCSADPVLCSVNHHDQDALLGTCDTANSSTANNSEQQSLPFFVVEPRLELHLVDSDIDFNFRALQPKKTAAYSYNSHADVDHKTEKFCKCFSKVVHLRRHQFQRRMILCSSSSHTAQQQDKEKKSTVQLTVHPQSQHQECIDPKSLSFLFTQ